MENQCVLHWWGIDVGFQHLVDAFYQLLQGVHVVAHYDSQCLGLLFQISHLGIVTPECLLEGLWVLRSTVLVQGVGTIGHLGETTKIDLEGTGHER